MPHKKKYIVTKPIDFNTGKMLIYLFSRLKTEQNTIHDLSQGFGLRYLIKPHKKYRKDG